MEESRLRSAFVFFFSSRRRHTRCLSDWSSDVCSSDLRHDHPARSTTPQTGRSGRGGRASGTDEGGGRRSEERRVGKECRGRWSAEQKEKKVHAHRDERVRIYEQTTEGDRK